MLQIAAWIPYNMYRYLTELFESVKDSTWLCKGSPAGLKMTSLLLEVFLELPK